MIWDIVQESNFDQHFNSPELSIQDLLLDENILTEMQNLNPKLLDFITTNQAYVIDKLIQYVIVMPTTEQGYDRCHKLPYISSEMLAIENPIFYQAFFPEEKEANHLKKLFSFLEIAESNQNTLLLGYFEKVVNNLCKGRKIPFTRSIAQNIELFKTHLDKQTIGSILKNCIILLNTDEGVLLEERKLITNTLIECLANEKNKRQVCSGALVQVMGKFQTFSSGDQILKLILSSDKFFQIYTFFDNFQVSLCVQGILSKSKMKKYDIVTDSQINIFKLPANHLFAISEFIKKRLVQIIKIDKENQFSKKVHVHVIQYFQMVKMALENNITAFVDEQFLQFVWKCMNDHPNCDILMVVLVKIIQHQINNKKNVDAIGQKIVFFREKNQKIYRPHIFSIWKTMKDSQMQVKNQINGWKQLNDKFTQLLPYHSKDNVKQVERPVNAKLIIDEEDMDTLKVAPKQQQKKEEPKLQKKSESQKEKIKADPFSEFNFMTEKPTEKKKDNQFADFANFGK